MKKKGEQTPSCSCAGLVSPVDLTCKTCGRPSIEGMGHSFVNMLGTSNLELTDYMNPQLTWKTVKKGFRSSSRRSRKPARTLNVSVQQVDKSSKRGKPSVAESEKLGVAVLGRRFAEKIEHVPIKKRRPPLQSPTTPPRTPSPHREESLSSQPSSSPQPDDFDQKTENKSISRCSDDICFPMAVQSSMKNDFVNNRKRSKVCNGKLGYTEDFSGIALLAAAACNSSTSDDAQEDKIGPTIDDFLTSGRIVSLVSATPLEKTTTSLEPGNLFLKESEKEESIDDLEVQDNSVVLSQNTSRSSSSKKEVRLHWDLNTVMEAWELHSDDLNTGSQTNGSDDAPDVIVNGEKPEKLEGHVSYGEHMHAPNRPLSKEKINSSPTSVIIPNVETSSGTSAILLGQKVFIENVDSGIHLDTAISGKVVCESDSIQAQEGSRKAIDLPGNRTSLTELVSSATHQMSDEGSASKSGKSGLSNASPVHDNSCRLDTTFRKGQPIGAVDVNRKQDKDAPTADAIPMDSSFHCEMNELMPKYYECLGKLDLIDATDDGKGLDVSNRRHGPTIFDGKMNQIEGGYESPFEDGELRESVVYSCVENDSETECVDYDSDCRDTDEFTAANQCTSEVGSDSYVNGDNGGFPDKELQSGRAYPLKGSSHSSSLIKYSGQNHFPEGFECSTERTSEANNIGTQKKFAADVVGSSEVGSRANRGIFSLNFEGMACSDALHRNNNGYMQRGRLDTCFQPGRMFTSEKYLERDRLLQRRNQGDSRNYYQSGYAQVTRYSKPRSIANSGAKTDGLTFRDQRRYTNYPSKDEHRPPIRQRSPADSADGYSASRRTVVARDNIDHIRSRGRGRGRRYGQGFSRVPREEYDEPMSNNAASFSGRPPHYFSRRERSFSPILGRGTSFSGPQQNSRSRPRSRSPLTFRVQRARNMEVRRLSRSPEFRSDARMGRGRMPFPKSNYTAYDEAGPISPSRTHFSSQRHPRWIDDEKCVSNNFVERKSPGRLIGARQKFDLGGFRGRTKSDGCFRSVIRRGRVPDYSDEGDRDHKFNGGNRERTKYHDKYDNIEKNHGLKRCNTSGVKGRFRIDEKGCSMLRDSLNEESCINGTDRRDIQRSTAEGRSPFRFSSERMYASGPKLSRVCDSNDAVSPSRE